MDPVEVFSPPTNNAPIHLLIDGLIILFYFAAITWIGLTFGRKDSKLNEFALGGRSVPWWAVMASIIAAETSAATFLGAPQEGYNKQSFVYVQLIVGVILGRLLVSYLFIKPYYALRVYTVYDYVAIRFGPSSRTFISGLFLVMRTLASGTRLFIPSLVIVLAWQLFVQGKDVSVASQAAASNALLPYFFAIVGLTIVTALYAVSGGIKAVIWTEIVQASLMFGAALLSIVTLFYHISDHSFNFAIGFSNLLEAVPALANYQGYFVTGFESQFVNQWQETHNLSQMSFWEYTKLILASDYTLFSAIIGATAGNMAAFGTDQNMVQRMLTAENYKKSRLSLISAALMTLPIATAFSFIGILLFTFYSMNPDLRPPAEADVFGSYILGSMPPGVRGIVLAGVFATAMGSFSAALNSLATSATNDWYLPRYGRRHSEETHVFVARVFTVIFAILMIAVATAFAYAKIAYPNLRIIPVVIGIASFILGPMLGVFLLGMVTKNRGSDRGNIIAICIGLVTTITLSKIPFQVLEGVIPGITQSFEWIPRVSFTWFALVGALVVFVVGILFRTPELVQRQVELRMAEAASRDFDDRPLALRDEDGDLEGRHGEAADQERNENSVSLSSESLDLPNSLGPAEDKNQDRL
jgi:SSS family transporter